MESRENNISAKTAVQKAIDYVRTLYADSQLHDLMLEEVEFSESTGQWLVTVGFSLPEAKKEETTPLFMPPNMRSRELSRRYKVVNIDAVTGEPFSMKIRAFN
jgi:hypothetical protein